MGGNTKDKNVTLYFMDKDGNKVSVGELSKKRRDKILENQKRAFQLDKMRNVMTTPISLKSFNGHEQESADIRNNSSKEAQRYIDGGVRNIEAAVEKLEFRSRVKENDIVKILSSGRLMNQLETHTTMGADAPDTRKSMSKDVFQHGGNLQPKDYEKYGYLGNGDTVAGSSYGDLDIVFKKDRMMNRTTITFGDSLFAHMAASRVTKPGIASLFGKNGWSPIPKNVTVAEAKRFAEQAKKLYDTGSAWGYAELQFHGNVTLDDIDHISVPKFWRGSSRHAETIRRIESYGIKVTYDDNE